MKNNLPKNLLKKVYWAFSKGDFASLAEFNEEVRDYHISIVEEDVWQPDLKVLNEPSIQICFEYWTDEGDELEEFIELTADNSQFFTAGELLFKINNATADKLKNGDHIFFEGLNLSETLHNDKPFYWMYLGS